MGAVKTRYTSGCRRFANGGIARGRCHSRGEMASMRRMAGKAPKNKGYPATTAASRIAKQTRLPDADSLAAR